MLPPMTHAHPTPFSRLALPLRIAALAALAATSIACGTVTPGPAPEIPRLVRPLLGDVTLTGLVFEDFRAAGYSTSVSSGVGSLYTPGTSTTPGTTHTINTTDVATTTHMERYDDASIQEELRFALEDQGVVRRFVPNARLHIQGRRVAGRATTGFGKMLWNALDGITLLSLVPGLPFLGDQAAEVELRVYWDGALVRSYRGEGTASWRKNAWGVAVELPGVKRSALAVATRGAVRDAVVAMIASPPPVPAD